MSFRIEFHARSRAHAKRLLDQHKSALPEPVFDFLLAGINGLSPLKEGAQRVLRVYAYGHLCTGDGSYAVSNAELGVTPIEIMD